MNKLLSLSLHIVILLFYFGCGDKQQTDQKSEPEKTSIKLVLNNGKKWQMDEHSRNAIKNLDSLLISHSSIKSIEEHQQLAEKLDEELILLIRGCTMEGPAHDQLHVFLGSFYPKVQSLKKETIIESSKNVLKELIFLLLEYHKYFE